MVQASHPDRVSQVLAELNSRTRAAESLDALDLSRILYPRVLDLVGSTLDERGGDGKSAGHARLARMRAS